ncbi:MAG: YgiQ family radical SAM protein [Bacteroidota bacterium]
MENLLKHNPAEYLPITKKELQTRGWEQLDVIIVSGDAYVDHPSFGHAVIGRLIESMGFRVAILPQPNWRDDLRDFKKLGKPRLFFGVTAGCMDSMVNHYTANKRLRSDDAYTPNNVSGFRPDYATVVYTNILKELYPDVPVILGGIEASMRRFTHYDYWSDALMPPILSQCKADILVYGMGELPIREITRRLAEGKSIETLRDVPQTAFLLDENQYISLKKDSTVVLPSHEACLNNKKTFASASKIIDEESNSYLANTIVQQVGAKYLMVNPAYPPMDTQQIDQSFDLPFTRLPHPKYLKKGKLTAWEMIKFSVNTHRGCFGGCSFCAIAAHQGKFIASRSEDSLLKELEVLTSMPDFKGSISDLGGPSANMYQMQGINLAQCHKCKRASCIFPSHCKNLHSDHLPLIKLYKKFSEHPKVNHLFIGSGIRYDMLTACSPETDKKNHYSLYIERLVMFHVSGRLKIAPEHSEEEPLRYMRKAAFSHFDEFRRKFEFYSAKANKKQQLIPYFISSHPGTKPEHMMKLALQCKKYNYRPEQVQDFTPTPGTLATAMFYTGLDPYTLQPLFVAKTLKEKQEQLRYLFWYSKENKNWFERKKKQ